jgi:large subunit ribosomal protein L31e
MATLERTYTIPLRASFRNAAQYRKTNKAVSAVKIFLKKHMKATDVKMGQHLNLFLWKDGIKSPPPRVTVHAVKDDDGVVRAELEGKTYKESVKPNPKEEASNFKDKLVDKLAGKEKPEEKADTPKTESKDAPVAKSAPAKAAPVKDAAKTVPKTDAKPADAKATAKPAEKKA